MLEEIVIGVLVCLVLIGLLVLPTIVIVMLASIRRRLLRLDEGQAGLREVVEEMKIRLDDQAPGVPAEKVEAKAVPPAEHVAAPVAEAKATPTPERPALPAQVLPAKPPPLPSLPPVPTPGPVAVPGAPPTPPKVSPIAESFRRLWTWVLMGGESRLEGVTREYAVATWWLLILGIAAISSCVVYFLKWSIEHGLIGPAGRVGLAVLFGVAMIASGVRMLGRKYHLMGQGLLGGGLLILYYSIFAASQLYELIPVTVAFALMVLVTLAAGVLAVTADSLLVAVLGLAGGYLTPVLLRTPDPDLAVLYAYVLLLGVGIMGVARFKSWRVLNYLGFLCTYMLYFGSLRVYERSDFVLAASFLSAFFVVHSWVCYAHNVGKGRRSTVADVIHLVANGVIYAGAAYHLVEGAHGRPFPAIMSLGLAVFYVLHVWVFLRRKLVDRRLLVSLIALAGVFTTWTLPLVFEKETLTISLSLVAFMFLWLGGRLESGFVQNMGYGIYAIVFYRLVLLDLPGNFRGAVPDRPPMGEYWRAMLDRLWTFGVSIGSVVAAFFMERRVVRSASSLRVRAENDTGRVLSRSSGAGVFYWFGLLFAFAFLHCELNAMFAYCDSFRLPVLTSLWCAMGAYFLSGHLRNGSKVMFAAMTLFLAGALLKLLTMDFGSWELCGDMYYAIAYAPALFCARFVDFGAIIGVMLAVWLLSGVRKGSRGTAAVFGYGALALFFIYSSLELNSFLHWRMQSFQQGGISVLWALFAVAFIACGIWRNLPPLRYAGLALFLVVAGKVFLVDLRDMEIIHRVIAFMIVGVALLLGSFAYIFAGKKFTRGDTT